jgi:hypothetical protein
LLYENCNVFIYNTIVGIIPSIWEPTQICSVEYTQFNIGNLFSEQMEIVIDKVPLDQFLDIYGFQSIHIPADGLCFLNSILLYLHEAFNLDVNIRDMSKRIYEQLFQDWEFCEEFFTANGAQDRQTVVKELHDLYFNKKEFDNQMVDIIVMRLATWFGLEIIITEFSNADKIKLIRVKNEFIGPSIYPKYYSTVIIIRSGDDVIEGRCTAHYNLILPNQFLMKYTFQNGTIQRVRNSAISIERRTTSTPVATKSIQRKSSDSIRAKGSLTAKSFVSDESSSDDGKIFYL